MRLTSLLTEKKEKSEKKGYDQVAANKAKTNQKLEDELKRARQFLEDITSPDQPPNRLPVGPGIIEFAKNWIAGLEVERAQRIGKKK